MVFGFIIFGNIGTNILFPWLHKHFHHWFNPNKLSHLAITHGAVTYPTAPFFCSMRLSKLFILSKYQPTAAGH